MTGLTNEVFHGQCSVEENAQVLTVRERDCGVVKVKGVEGNGRQFLSSSDEHHFYLFTIQFKFGLGHRQQQQEHHFSLFTIQFKFGLCIRKE